MDGVKCFHNLQTGDTSFDDPEPSVGRWEDNQVLIKEKLAQSQVSVRQVVSAEDAAAAATAEDAAARAARNAVSVLEEGETREEEEEEGEEGEEEEEEWVPLEDS